MYASSLNLIFKDMMTTAQALLEYAALAETAIEAEAGGESEERLSTDVEGAIHSRVYERVPNVLHHRSSFLVDE